jgi:hypothetical protein
VIKYTSNHFFNKTFGSFKKRVKIKNNDVLPLRIDRLNVVEEKINSYVHISDNAAFLKKENQIKL